MAEPAGRWSDRTREGVLIVTGTSLVTMALLLLYAVAVDRGVITHSLSGWTLIGGSASLSVVFVTAHAFLYGGLSDDGPAAVSAGVIAAAVFAAVPGLVASFAVVSFAYVGLTGLGLFSETPTVTLLYWGAAVGGTGGVVAFVAASPATTKRTFERLGRWKSDLIESLREDLEDHTYYYARCSRCGSTDVDTRYNGETYGKRCRNCNHKWGVSIYETFDDDRSWK